jgi:hypothetical protein
MKNILIIIVLFASALGFTQESNKDKASVFSRKHELKIGAIHLLGASTFAKSYSAGASFVLVTSFVIGGRNFFSYCTDDSIDFFYILLIQKFIFTRKSCFIVSL